MNSNLNKTLNIFRQYLLAHLFFLVLMGLFRGVFFIYYNPLESLEGLYFDLFNAFVLGMRIDITVLGYIQALPTIALITLYFLKKEVLLRLFQKISPYYLFVMYTVASALMIADFGFYSYFKDRINILFFGLFDDDTQALAVTIWQNYNVLFIAFCLMLYFMFLFFMLRKIFLKEDTTFRTVLKLRYAAIVFFIIFALNFIAIRGTFGMYPLGKMIPNVSANDFINKLSQNGVRAFASAYDYRKEYLEKEYDLIKATGFDKDIAKAFEIYADSDAIDRKNLLNNITRTTPENPDDYNVVVIMVESFGLPITQYQSDAFNLLGALKKHFEQDLLFTQAVSSANGTVSNLQSLLLNIPHRPNSFAFSQSIYKQTPFTYSPAFVYAKKGYETSFIYGGDLTWRNLGEFIKYQGYDHLEGKMHVYNSLQTRDDYDYFHPWGIYDEFLYEHIFNKLHNAGKKQFIVALSTNNHPPYNLPKQYNPKSLTFTSEVQKIITGDSDLAFQRLRSFQYAVNAAGEFLDKLKSSPLKDNTVVVVTADDNTVDGIMRYADRELFRSKNIPLYFYLPPALRQTVTADTSAPASHKDIFPTLYNLTLDRQPYIALGSNLFDPKSKKIGFNGGNMIVHTQKETKRLNTLEQKTDDPDLLYYKAVLAITQYLIDAQKNDAPK
jgi:phosphoglycerol transferase MdoB-like AlkP superfamily enzyme